MLFYLLIIVIVYKGFNFISKSIITFFLKF